MQSALKTADKKLVNLWHMPVRQHDNEMSGTYF
jgi:hypothetical protein